MNIPLPILVGLITAAMEYPISQRYATVPATSTANRMLIAGAMAAGAVYLAQMVKK